MVLFKDRLAVIIGKHGDTKKLLEQKTGTHINIDSESGEYQVTPNMEIKFPEENNEFQDPNIRVFTAQTIINAINYGFNPIKALKLMDAEMIFELINLEQILGHSPSKLKRMKGRLIGDQGKFRQDLEKFSGANISIYGKYIALIGDYEAIKTAKKAINMILQGAPHKTVLNYLYEEYQKKKQAEFTEMWKPTL